MSNDSESDVDHYYLKSEMANRKKKEFFYSQGLSMQERIQVFRNEYSEFSQLDDEHVETLIKIYDINLQKKFVPCDSSLSVTGLLIIWFGWIFFNSASGMGIVEYDYDRVP